MALSAKHYREVADILAGELTILRHNTEAWYVARDIALSLADMFAKDNPSFDRDRFYDAVGGSEFPHTKP